MARRAVAFAVLLALALLAWWWIDGSRTRAERRDAPGGHGRERVAQRRDDVGAPSLTDTEPARAATYGVTVRDQVGRSLPGLHVGAFRGRSDVAAASTNDKGVAILAGVTGAPVRLYVQPDLGGSIDVAVVDPADGDRDFTATVGLTEMVLRVTLDGEARAPKTWTFRPRLRHVSVDADGTIRGTWAMDGTPTISFLASFQSPGYFTKPLHIGLPNDTRLDVPLRSQHALTIDARAPHDVQRRNGGWHAIKKWDLVPPGTYRVRDRATGAVSDPATIRPQDGGATLRLRIAQLASVEGIVVVPPACDLSQCRVHIQGEGIDQSGLPGAPVDGKTGAFRVEIPGDRKVRLVPHHRFLVPDTTVKTATKERGVVLRMRAAPLVRFRLPAGWPLPRFNDKLEEIPVYLTRNGNRTFAERAWEKDGIWTFIAREGAHGIWIDVPAAVPVEVTAEIARAGHDLGTLSLRRGSRVFVHYQYPAGAEVGFISVSVERIGHPAYGRGNHPTQVQWKPGDKPQNPVVVQGLGPGRYRLYATARMADGSLDETIELDGVHDLHRSVDLR